jgi:hypothetical protein
MNDNYKLYRDILLIIVIAFSAIVLLVYLLSEQDYSLAEFFGKPDRLSDSDVQIYILNYEDDPEQEPIAAGRYLWPLKLYISFQEDHIDDVYMEYRRDIYVKMPFDAEKWKSPDLVEREQMVENLISILKEKEHTKTDVLDVLGGPDGGRGMKRAGYYYGKKLLFLVFDGNDEIIDFGVKMWD